MHTVFVVLLVIKILNLISLRLQDNLYVMLSEFVDFLDLTVTCIPILKLWPAFWIDDSQQPCLSLLKPPWCVMFCESIDILKFTVACLPLLKPSWWIVFFKFIDFLKFSVTCLPPIKPSCHAIWIYRFPKIHHHMSSSSKTFMMFRGF